MSVVSTAAATWQACGIALALALAGFLPNARAAAPPLTAAETEFFESKIRPVLVENCYKCHSAGAEKIKGGLLLDTRDGVLKGGDTGPAIVPGNVEKSLLITAVRYKDKDLQMPPADKKLPDNVITDLEQWVRMGAPDPRTEAASAKAVYGADLDNAKRHWAYKPVGKPAVPNVEDKEQWAQNDIDRFILAGFQSKALAPSPKADKVTLLRRATFDLHGLPPTGKEVNDFVADESASAFAKVIDRLLASPRYGERWGRYWLDLAKFADTKGPQNPLWTPWFAFSALPAAEFATKGRELSATFYANADKKNPLNPQVAKLFSASPKDIKQVAARYGSLFTTVSKQWDGILAGYESRKRGANSPLPEPEGLPDKDLDSIRKVLYGKGSPAYLDDRVVQGFINRDDRTRDTYNTLQRALNDVRGTHPGAPARAHIMEDSPKPRDSYVLVKGNPGNRGAVVPRQAPEIIGGATRQPFKDGSGRLELAQTIISKDNPLTVRVLVNRVWLHHFGAGLVSTPDDFGVRSEPPTNPGLLDYLAARFMEDGWSLKSLHRLMMLSATWQQSSDENARFNQIDPDNRSYWQFNRQRLDFESLRDTILYIGGRLDLTMGGPGVRLDSEPYSTRRTVYGYLDRTRLPNMHLAFDFANPNLTTGKRNSTIVPQQALFMMNSPLVVEQAKNLTLRGDFKSRPGAEQRIKLLYKLIYQRAPTEIETRLALDYIRGEASVTATNAGALAWEYGYGEFDPAVKQLKSFVQLSTFNGNAWVTGNRRVNLGPIALTAKGGRPGHGIAFGAIRRWTARRDGFIAIDGMLTQGSKGPSDAVRGWIVSGNTGMLGAYAAQKSQAPTRLPRVLVKRGDTINFVVAGKGPFLWAPTVKFIEGVKAGEVAEWAAEKEFSGTVAPKHLEAWEKFAQVLLETNEMTFVN